MDDEQCMTVQPLWQCIANEPKTELTVLGLALAARGLITSCLPFV